MNKYQHYFFSCIIRLVGGWLAEYCSGKNTHATAYYHGRVREKCPDVPPLNRIGGSLDRPSPMHTPMQIHNAIMHVSNP